MKTLFQCFFQIGLVLLVLPFLLSCGVGVGQGMGLVGPPTVSSATTTPNSDGSITVTITGSGFVEGTTVTVSGVSCTNVHILSSTQLTCVLPSGSIALVNIIVTSPSSGSSGPSSAYHTLFVAGRKAGSDVGTLNQADEYCRQQAVASGAVTASLSGHWRAILSNSSESAKDRITFAAGSSIKNTAGETLVNSSADLWSGSLLTAVNYNAYGNAVINFQGIYQVWTGSYSDGSKVSTGSADNNCGNWGTSSASGVTGNLHQTGSAWITGGASTCNDGNHSNSYIYCINSNN